MSKIVKIILFLGGVAVSSSALYITHFDQHNELETKKDYNFDYSVHDPHSHEYSHSHQETSKDGVVKGYYSVKDADGSLREVHYTADKDGFKAIVTKNGVQVHPHTDGTSHSTTQLDDHTDYGSDYNGDHTDYSVHEGFPSDHYYR